MNTTMTLARALKEKNRIAGRLKTARDRISRENSWEKSVPRNFNVEELISEAKKLKQNLITLKTAIAIANAGIVGKIIEMAELKAEICWLSGVDTYQGTKTEQSYRSEVPIVREFVAVVTGPKMAAEVTRLQHEVEAIQDQIDEYNAVTKISVDLIPESENDIFATVD